MMRGRRKNRKGKVCMNSMNEEVRGRVEEGKLQGESLHDMQDQTERS